MATPSATPRLAKGTNLVELVKLLRHVRKQRSFPSFGPGAERLLEERVLPTAWYPHGAFLELVEFAFRSVLGGNEAKAYEMGSAGGRVLLQGSHKALIDTTNPVESVLAMRHSWGLHFNFGSLRAAAEGKRVIFRLSDYPDVPRSHAYMIAGWGAASGQLAGAARASAKVLEGPWDGASELVYQVSLSS